MNYQLVQRSLLALTLVATAAIGAAQTPRWTEDGSAGSFNTSAWTVDRFAPGGWTPGATDPLGGTALKLSILNADRLDLRPSAYQSTFYNTQGRTRATVKSSEVGGQLYIPADWSTPGNLRRSDLWAADTAFNTFPIIGFINNDPADPFNPNSTNFVPRIRVWDSGAGAWIDLNLTINWGAYNSFKIVDTGHSDQFFFNGTMVEELSGASYASPGQNCFEEVLVEGYNFGDPTGTPTPIADAGYDIYWKNVYSKDAPQAHNDAYTVDSGVTKPAPLNVFANDVDPAGNAFMIYGFTDPAHGQVNLNRGQLQYLPTGTYAGADSFKYYIVDAFGQVSSATVSLTDQYPIFTGMTFNPTTVLGGSDTTATITLNGAPVTTTYTIALSSSDPSVTVPSTVTINSGNSVTFPVHTSQVATDLTATITAVFHGKTLAKTFTVKADRVASVTVDQASIIGGAADANATVTLQAAPTTYPVTVNLTTSLPSGLAVQSSVVVPVGNTSVTVPLVSHPVAAGATVIVTATTSGTSATGHVSVQPVRISTFALGSRSLHPGASTTGTVTLNATLKAGESVTIPIANTSGKFNAPASLTITGAISGVFTISAPNPNSVGLTVIVPIGVSLAGASSSSTIQLFAS